tara:strand:- start:463 stop:2385 length:1923 start_codon:yes stop_codon:yes gene_type:complete
MATLAEFRAEYPQYDSVPDLALADSLHQKFYAKIPKMDFYKTIGLGSAAAIPGAENVITGKAAPEVSMRDRIMGVIETPAVLAGGLASSIAAPLATIYGELANAAPQGSPQAIAAGKAMAAKAREQFYQPRTQTSKEILGAVGEFLQPITGALPPTLGAVGTSINALAPAALMQAGAVARPAITQATAPVRNALANVMTREQPGMVGMGAASTAEDLMRQQRLEQFGIRATAGERERNLQKQQFESDVQRGALPGVSEDVKAKLGRELGAFKVGQKEDILNQFERMTEEVGGTIDRSTPRALGTFVDKTLSNIYTDKFKDYKAKYKLADDSGETLEQVPYQSLLDYIGTKSTTRREKLDPILNDVAELLGMNDPQKTGTISIRNLEDIYQVVGTAKDSPSARPLKDLITKIGDGAGGKLYQDARQARTQLAKEFEDVYRVDKLLGTKAGYKDRQVALDDVYNHIIVDGPLEEMRTVTSLLKKTPEGQKAYQELQGYTLQRMKDLLLKKGDESEAVRLNNFNNFVTQLDREDKLNYMFGKTGRDKLLDLKQSISDVMVKEPGAVNYPNTAGAVLRGLEALQNLPVKIPGTQTAAEFARGRQYKKQLKESLKQPNQLAPKQPNQNNLAPPYFEVRGVGSTGE